MARPRKYKEPAKMQAEIDIFFAEEETPTITGLALALGFTSRADLINYEGYSQEFHYTIKKAKLKIECEYEKALRKHNSTGPIFALKNFGWSDKQEIEHTGDISHKIIKWKPASEKK